MHRRLNHPAQLWIAGLLSAIFFCLVVAFGGSAGSWRAGSANIVPAAPHSGGMDGSHQPSARFLVSPNRHAVLSLSESDKGPGLDLGGDPGSATVPYETARLEQLSDKPFFTAARQARRPDGTSGYSARAPPALI